MNIKLAEWIDEIQSTKEYLNSLYGSYDYRNHSRLPRSYQVTTMGNKLLEYQLSGVLRGLGYVVDVGDCPDAESREFLEIIRMVDNCE